MERLLSGIAGFVQKRPKAVLLGLALFTGFFAIQLMGLSVAYDPLEFMPSDSRVNVYREIESEFGIGNYSHLLTLRFETTSGYLLQSTQAVNEMDRVLESLREIPGIIEVRGIPDFVKFVHQELHGGDPNYYSLSMERGDDSTEIYTPEELIRLAFQTMALMQQYTSPRGTALATATIASDADIIAVARQAEEALAPLRSEAIATTFDLVSYGGTLDLFNTITSEDISNLIPIVFAMIVLVMIWVFRRTRTREVLAALALIGIVAVVVFVPNLIQEGWQIPIAVAGLALLVAVVGFTFRSLSDLYLTLIVVTVAGIWTFGALGVFGVSLNFLMVAVIPLLLGVGVDDTLHLLHRYEEERCKGRNGAEAISIAISKTGQALLLTTLTTTAGFAALALAPSPPLRWFGLLAVLAMVSAFVVTIFLVPSIKHLMNEPARVEAWPPKGSMRPLAEAMGHPKESFVSRFLHRYTGWVQLRPIAVILLLGGTGLAAAGYWFGHNFETFSIDYRQLLPEEHPVIKLHTEINQEFRPYDEVQIQLSGDLARLDVMRILQQEIPQALASSPYAHEVSSIGHLLDDIRSANAELSAGFMERFLIEPDEGYAWLLSQVFSRSNLRSRAAAYVSVNGANDTLNSVVRVNTIRYSDQSGIAKVTSDLTRRLEPALNRLEELGIQAEVTGTPYLEESGLAALRNSFLQTLILSLLFCFATLTLVLRSPLWGAVAIFPVFIIVGLVLGSLVLFDMEINAATAVVAAVGLGLGIDYSIHLINRFREEGELAKAATRTGEALSAAFFSTAAAFFALIFSQITWNQDFGILSGLVISFSFGATIFLLTALLGLLFSGKPGQVRAKETSKSRAFVNIGPAAKHHALSRIESQDINGSEAMLDRETDENASI